MTLSSSTPKPAPEKRLETFADALVVGFARHWLAIFNLAWLLYVGIPFLAPVLMHWGWSAPAQVIYTVYSFFCHQLPDHSYFLFGNHFAPLKPELVAAGLQTGTLFQERAFIGNPEIGYKVAICERDVAIYGSIALAGLIYALIRKQVAPIAIKWYLLFLIPIAVDGLTQMIGLRESNWWLRSITGVLFGVGSAWLAYPYVQGGMDDVIEHEARRLVIKQGAGG